MQQKSAGCVSFTSGFSTVELLIVLAVLGILLGLGVQRFGSNGARAYSNDVRSIVQQARFEAVKRNAPVAVIWNGSANEFRTILGSGVTPCVPGSVLVTAAASRYRGVSVETEFLNGDGIVWLPSGQARSCSLGVFSPAIAEISDRNHQYNVTVTLTGRVTVE